MRWQKTLLALLLMGALLVPAASARSFCATYPNGVWVGVSSGTSKNTPDVTPGKNDLYVVGTSEFDGAARFDGAVTFNDTVDVTGTVTFSGAVGVGTDLTVGDELYFYEAGGLLISNKIDVNAAEAFVFYGPTDDANLADVTCMTISTAAVSIDVGDLEVGTISADDGSLVITLADSTALATFAGAIDVSDVECATLSSRGGDQCIALTDSTALATFAGAIDVGDVELATVSSRAGDLAITIADSTALATFAGAIDAPDIELATASARDGQLALTFTSSTGVVVFAATPTGGSLDFSGTLECDILEADTITNEAGSGAPSATYGFVVGADIIPDTDGNDNVGTFAKTFAAVCATEVDCDTIGDSADGTDAITIAADGKCTFPQDSTFSGSATITDGDLVFGDGTYLTFAIDINGNAVRTRGSSNGDSLLDTNIMLATTSTISVVVAELDCTNVATVINFGSASSTTGSKVSVFDGSTNQPGAVAFFADDGNDFFLWAASAGALRLHSAYPTDADSDGVAIGTFNQGVDVDLTATGGSTGDGDLTVAGYAKFAGTVELDGSVILDGTLTINDNVLKRVWIPASEFKLPTSNPATESETGTVGTLTFSQATAVDYAWFTWVVPQDCATGSDAEMYYVYTPASNVGGIGAGTWSSEINAMTDGSAVAAAAVAIEDVADTPQGSGDTSGMGKWNTTSGATIPHANLAVDTVINVQIYHDYNVSAFGNDALLAGVWIEYVADKLGE